MSKSPELSLIEAATPPPWARERAAWAFEHFATRVTSFLLRLTGDEGEAESLAQEVFLRLLGSDGDFATGAALRAWLYRVARNLALDHHKRRKPRFGLDANDVGGSPEGGPVDALLGSEDLTRLRDALDRLPEIYRATLVLRYFEEWSYDRIAEHEGVSQSALRTRVQKAIQLLRSELGLADARTRPIDHRSQL